MGAKNVNFIQEGTVNLNLIKLSNKTIFKKYIKKKITNNSAKCFTDSLNDKEKAHKSTTSKERIDCMIINFVLEQLYEPVIRQLCADIAKKTKRKNNIKMTGMHVDQDAINLYIEEVFLALLKRNMNIADMIKVPMRYDPLNTLGQLQGNDYHIDSDSNDTNFSVTPPILPMELYISLELSKKMNSIDDIPRDLNHKKFLKEWCSIYDKCIFDAINDALDYYRPYELQVPPFPWTNNTMKLTYEYGSEVGIDRKSVV